MCWFSPIEYFNNTGITTLSFDRRFGSKNKKLWMVYHIWYQLGVLVDTYKKKKDRHKTGFEAQQGHWQWINLPFGLNNAPVIFQRIITGIIRRNDLSDFVIAYLDDILIFSRTFEEHIEHLERLTIAILREGFRLKFSKCTFASNSVLYFGHLITKNSIQPTHNNLISIKDSPLPEN